MPSILIRLNLRCSISSYLRLEYIYPTYIRFITCVDFYTHRIPYYFLTTWALKVVPDVMECWGTIMEGSVFVTKSSYEKTRTIMIAPDTDLLSLYLLELPGFIARLIYVMSSKGSHRIARSTQMNISH